MNGKRTVTVALGFVCLFGVAVALYGADIQVATWKINLAKSKYNPSNLAPKSTTVKNDALQGELGTAKVTVDVVDYTGKTIQYEYIVRYDGNDYPTRGDPNRDATALKKIDDYTFEQTNKKGGKVTTTSKIVYARDGKSRTMTTTGTNPQGQKVNNTIVWDKQ